MTRASVSVPSNIAERYSRSSDKEFVKFLKMEIDLALNGKLN